MKSTHQGFALLTALIFLVILTLVAITSLRTSGLELRMSTNNAMRTEAFESSDSPRLIIGDLLDAHVYSRGWPDDPATGGTIPAAEFDYPIAAGLSFPAIPPPNWYVNNSDEAGNCQSPFRSTSGGPCRLRTDATYARNVATSEAQALQIRSDLAIFKLRVDLSPGAGAAMVAGYEGTGKSAASSGGRIHFYVNSVGRDSAPAGAVAEANTETGTMYRHVIRN